PHTLAHTACRHDWHYRFDRAGRERDDRRVRTGPEHPNPTGENMPKYVIEREMPGAGSLSTEELQGIAAKSNEVIGELGTEVRWLTSYVTDDKAYCVYVAPDEDILREHARRGGF